MLDRTKGPERPAELRYHSGEFQILKAGSYVTCAVTGDRIALEDLRYWSAELQEPYATPGAANERFEKLKAVR